MSRNNSRSSTPSSSPARRRATMAGVSLGSAATAYYFSGAPPTPVQTMVQQQQRRSWSGAHHMPRRMEKEDAAMNTGTAEHTQSSSVSIMNQSYLSSSSDSSAEEGNEPKDLLLNTSVLSDTTELTASHFVTLAATHRTTAEKGTKPVDETPSSKNEVPSVTQVAVLQSAKEKLSQRRQTLSGVVTTKAAAAKNKIAEFQRRQSEGGIATVKRRNSKTPLPSDMEHTAEMLLFHEGTTMPTSPPFLSTPEKNQDLSQLSSPARHTRSSTKKSAAKGLLALHQSHEPNEDSLLLSSIQSPSSKKQALPKDSPARNTRSSEKKKKNQRATPTKKSPSPSQNRSPASSFLLHLSPAKCTRSATRFAADTTVTLGGDVVLDAVIASTVRRPDPQSPSLEHARSPARRSKTKEDRAVDSPARNTRSAQKHTTEDKNEDSPNTADLLAKLLETAQGGGAPLDISQEDSTASLGDLLNDYLVTTKESATSIHSSSSGGILSSSSKHNVESAKNDSWIATNGGGDISVHSSGSGMLSSQHNVESSKNVPSNVSKASTIETPFGMSRNVDHDPLVGPSRSSPPSTIRMPAMGLAEGVSPFAEPVMHAAASTTMGQSPLRKALTPSKLAPSPRRFILSNSSSQKRPKSALTPSRLPPSPLRLANQGVAQRRSSFTQLQPSPLRPKRSNDENSSTVKRQKTFETLQDLVKEPYFLTVNASSSTTATPNLPSVLRQPGQPSARSSHQKKRVGFRSPTFAEFHATSPAERVTPMIKTPRDNSHQPEAGTTPFATRLHPVAPNSNASSNMSVDSLAAANMEPTVTLEVDMSTLLKEAPPMDLVPPPQLLPEEEDNTMELETDINALLHMTNDQAEEEGLPVVDRRSLVFDEPTTELEENMNDLLHDDDALPIASRRFSMAPSRRLSLSLDGTFDHSAQEAVMTDGLVMEEEVALTLTVGEVVDRPLLMDALRSGSVDDDVLVAMDPVFRKNGMSETIDMFSRQVLETILNQTDPEVNLDAPVDHEAADMERCLALQKYVRSGNQERRRQQMQSMAQSIQDLNQYEWLLWLTSATEQLNGPLDEDLQAISNELYRLDQLCYDAEQCLSSIANKAVRQARRTHVETRKAEVTALEKTIAEMEGDLHMFQEKLDQATTEANMYADLQKAIQEHRALSSAVQTEETCAMGLSLKCETLRGAMKFKPSLLKDRDYIFEYRGSSPKSCMILSFHAASSSSVRCDAKVDAALHENPFTLEANRLATVSSFLQIRMTDLCDKLCARTLSSTSEIAPQLRRVEWELGRLEGTAREVAVLKERYRNQVAFTRTGASMLFQLKVIFASPPGSRRLAASFQIPEEYPFSPLDICLDTFDEAVDVEALQTLLVKNAKPGFGYLSRICDILAASVQGGGQ